MADISVKLEEENNNDQLENIKNKLSGPDTAMVHTNALLKNSSALDLLSQSIKNAPKLPFVEKPNIPPSIAKESTAAKSATKDIEGDLIKGLPEKLKSGANSVKEYLASVLGDVFKDIDASELFDSIKDVGTSLISLGISGEQVDLMKKIGDATGQAQEKLLSLDKVALTAGLSFGQSFSEAKADIGAFRKSVVETMNDFVATDEEVKKVSASLQAGFSTQEQIKSLDELTNTIAGVPSGLTLMDVAMASSAATGMSDSETINIMTQARLKFGASVEDSALAIGEISAATKDSGLQFRDVSGAIMSGADSLRLWGGTIQSVRPMFEAFSDSLAKGQKGLAPELYINFVKGLESMDFSKKAFMGLGSGLGGGSALGAGLEFEETLGEPDGVRKAASMISDKIKNLTGGELITKEQTKENPALVEQYILQRRLMSQFLNINEASAGKTLSALKQLEESGGKSNSAMEEFSNNVSAGQQTRQETATSVERAQITHLSNIQTSAGQLIELTTQLVDRVKAGGIAKAKELINRTAQRGGDSAYATSKVTGVDVKEQTKPVPELTDEIGKMTSMIKEIEGLKSSGSSSLDDMNLVKEKISQAQSFLKGSSIGGTLFSTFDEELKKQQQAPITTANTKQSGSVNPMLAGMAAMIEEAGSILGSKPLEKPSGSASPLLPRMAAEKDMSLEEAGNIVLGNKPSPVRKINNVIRENSVLEKPQGVGADSGPLTLAPNVAERVKHSSMAEETNRSIGPIQKNVEANVSYILNPQAKVVEGENKYSITVDLNPEAIVKIVETKLTRNS